MNDIRYIHRPDPSKKSAQQRHYDPSTAQSPTGHKDRLQKKRTSSKGARRGVGAGTEEKQLDAPSPRQREFSRLSISTSLRRVAIVDHTHNFHQFLILRLLSRFPDSNTSLSDSPSSSAARKSTSPSASVSTSSCAAW